MASPGDGPLGHWTAGWSTGTLACALALPLACGTSAAPGQRASAGDAGTGSGSSSGAKPGPDAGSTSDSGSDSGRRDDSGVGPDAGTGGDGSGGGADAGPLVGAVLLLQPFPATGAGEFVASFGPAAASDSCAGATAGGCTLHGCPHWSGATTDDAGDISVLGSPSGSFIGPVTIPYRSGALYDYTGGPAVAAGQTLTVSTTGGAVPAFGPVAMVMPSSPTLVGPASPIVVSTSTDLAVTWSGGQPGATFVFQGLTATGYFECRWDAMAGDGAVPQAILKGLGAATNATIVSGQAVRQTVDAGAYAIDVEAIATTSSSATFQ